MWFTAREQFSILQEQLFGRQIKWVKITSVCYKNISFDNFRLKFMFLWLFNYSTSWSNQLIRHIPTQNISHFLIIYSLFVCMVAEWNDSSGCKIKVFVFFERSLRSEFLALYWVFKEVRVTAEDTHFVFVELILKTINNILLELMQNAWKFFKSPTKKPRYNSTSS